jgi:4-oxalocrotonate tautomerase family enzyme
VVTHATPTKEKEGPGMPFWEIYTPEDAFTDEDKEALTKGITSIYYDLVDLPKFYVVVVFHEMPLNSIYVGGEAANNFIRIRLDHIARKTVDYIAHHANKNTMVNGIAVGSLTSEQIRADFHEKVEEVLVPFVKERGYDWEIHVDETPEDLWRVQGLVPPPEWSEFEELWRKENRPVPYY